MIGNIETHHQWSLLHQRHHHQRLVTPAIKTTHVPVIRNVNLTSKILRTSGVVVSRIREILFDDNSVILCEFTGNQVWETCLNCLKYSGTLYSLVCVYRTT